MNRTDFQRLLACVDTLHDFKSASDRGKLSKEDEKIAVDLLDKLVEGINERRDMENEDYDNMTGTDNSDIQSVDNATYPNDIVWADPANADPLHNPEPIKYYDEKNIRSLDDLTYDIETFFKFYFKDKPIPPFIQEYIEETPVVSNKDGTLIAFMKYLHSKPKHYNPGNIIEVLTLIFIHDDFRDSLGLSKEQRYINKIQDCRRPNFLDPNETSRDFCEKIYYDTYQNNTFYKVTTNLEAKMKDVLMNSNKIYDGKTLDWSGSLVVNTNTKYVDLTLGNKTKGTGIFKSQNESNDLFYETMKKVFGCETILFAYDSNGLNNEWMQNRRYKGLFVDYDSFNQDAKKTLKGGMPPPPKKREEKSVQVSSTEEFQQYKLTKKKNELLFVDEIAVKNADDGYNMILKLKTNINVIVDLSKKSKDKNGLPMFLKLFDEINKKTLGYKNRRKEVSEQLKSGLEKAGLEDLKKMYRITLADVADNDPQYIVLNKEEFIKALFDFKRAMDYLYVKASLTANMREKIDAKFKEPQKRKFVFVSTDLSAICYSIFLNNPCILTHAKKSGEISIEIFNPDETYYNYDELATEYKNMRFPSSSRSSVGPSTSAQNAPGPSSSKTTQNGKNTYQTRQNTMAPTTSMPVQQSKNASQTRQNTMAPTTSMPVQPSKNASQTRQNTMEPTTSVSTQQSKNASQTRQNTMAPTTSVSTQQSKNASQIRQNTAEPSTSYRQIPDAVKQKTKNTGQQNSAENSKTNLLQMICRDIVRDTAGEIYNINVSKRLSAEGMRTLDKRLKQDGITRNDFLDYIFPQFNKRWDVIEKLYSKKMPKNRDVREIMRNISDRMVDKKNSSFSGGNSTERKTSIVDEEIPINGDLTSICEYGSPLHTLLAFYAKLSPTISFFWFVTFKTLMFVYFGDEMDKAKCDLSILNARVQNTRNGSSSIKTPTSTFTKKKNVNNDDAKNSENSFRIRTTYNNNTIRTDKY